MTNSQIKSVDMDGNLMLHNAETGDILVLNETARLVFEEAQNNRSVEHIMEAVVDRFDVADTSKAQLEVEQCLERLQPFLGDA